jgi:hypothetical protein
MTDDYTGGPIRVNFSDDEAEAKDFEPLPTGKYNCKITDVEMRYSQSEKNPGKPMYGFEFTVQDGQYTDRKIWTNACLWDGALYTIASIMKALGYNVESGSMEIPIGDDFIGKDIVVRMAKGKAQIGDGTKENPQYPAKVEARGFSAPAAGNATSSSGRKAGSLLP